MTIPNTLCFLSLILILSSCSSNDETTDDSENTNSTAKPVYNQAYQENFEPDRISDILIQANNAYIIIDPFIDNAYESVSALKQNNNEVGAYISIGTGENFRNDFNAMQPYLVSRPWGEWPDEYFVKSTTTGVINVMKARIDQISIWGCDWVEFDNMDWVFDDDLRRTYNFQVTEQEGIAYYQELCDYVHSKGMKCMAKNMTEYASNFDGVLYESYNDEKNWWDVTGAREFLNAGKLVIVNHYNETNCGQVYSQYKGIYNNSLSFICEDANTQSYQHFNQ